MTDEERAWALSHFDRCAPWIQAALDHAAIQTHTIEHVRHAVENGAIQIWPRANSVVITELLTYPTGVKVLHTWLAGGDLKEILATNEVLNTFAKDQGCAVRTLTGRKGWARILKGWAPPGQITLAKEM